MICEICGTEKDVFHVDIYYDDEEQEFDIPGCYDFICVKCAIKFKIK